MKQLGVTQLDLDKATFTEAQQAYDDHMIVEDAAMATVENYLKIKEEGLEKAANIILKNRINDGFVKFI
jgi:outer membrane protein assembly factor BamD (BamD/ComL family)